MRKINLPLQDLEHQEPVEVLAHFIELSEHTIRWFAEFQADETPKDDEGGYDKARPKEKVYNYFDITVLKKNISRISLIFLDKPNLYKVYIQAVGTDDDIDLYFESQEKAIKLKEALVAWAFLKEPS